MNKTKLQIQIRQLQARVGQLESALINPDRHTRGTLLADDLGDAHEFDLATIKLVTDAVLDLVMSRGIIGRDAIDPRLDSPSDRLADVPESFTVSPHRGTPRCIANLAEVLLPGWAQIERDIAETGYVILKSFEHHIGIVGDFHGHPEGFIGTVITDSDGETMFIALEGPHMFDEITGQTELSRTDVAACLGYLICLFGDAICVFGPGDGRLGSLVGNLGEAVSVLRRLVGDTGLDDANDAEQGASDADAQRDESSSIHPSSLGDDSTGGAPFSGPRRAAEEAPATAAQGWLEYLTEAGWV